MSLCPFHFWRHIFSLAFLSWKLSIWIFRKIEMWVSSASPLNLSLIGSPTTEIYYRTVDLKSIAVITFTLTSITSKTLSLNQEVYVVVLFGRWDKRSHPVSDIRALAIRFIKFLCRRYCLCLRISHWHANCLCCIQT